MAIPATISDNARALLLALRAADGMYREMCGILSGRGNVSVWGLHRANPDTIAAAVEIGGKLNVVRHEHTPNGYCYDEVRIEVDGLSVSVYGESRQATAAELAVLDVRCPMTVRS